MRDYDEQSHFVLVAWTYFQLANFDAAQEGADAIGAQLGKLPHIAEQTQIFLLSIPDIVRL